MFQKASTFQVYNASAGSGKTFTLVKEYLKVLLTSDDLFTFQKILAITFTNKAAGEMKERVLQNLEDFSNGKNNDLFNLILQETKLESTLIQEKSQQILSAVLQNYSAFSITTIDSFTHKIIRSFAFDLGLTLNFEVEMDAVSLLNEAVSVLISKIGTDEKLTKMLIDYSIEKTNEDKSWDISNDLNEFSKILLNEEDSIQFRQLAHKTIDDFNTLKNKLFSNQKELEKELKAAGKTILSLLESNNLSQKDFYRGVVPKFFNDLIVKGANLDVLKRGATIEKAIEANQFYTKNTAEITASTIDNIIPNITKEYQRVKQVYKDFLFNKLALQSIIPLAVLNNINNELEQLKNDNNIRLNVEFNQLISKKIKDQPAPFIYERIGQRFMHYFIDEMQDTSSLQWQNLIPLIDNALAQEKSSLLLVGDGKQAIYRWRGGKAEQFINLGNRSNNQKYFQIQKEVKQLNTNFRSYSEIVNFTNTFFTKNASFLENKNYQNLFLEGNKQKENTKKGGYVSIDFLETKEQKAEDDLKYATAVLQKVKTLQREFSLNEICILTRTKKDGITIADYLIENNISIVSSETLLIKNNAKVNFIINLLQLIQNPAEDEVKFNVLLFLFDHLKVPTQKHQFLQTFIKKNNTELFSSLTNFSIQFDQIQFKLLPLYDKIETIISAFKIVNTSDAYIQFFLDIALEQQIKGIGVSEFLDFWKAQKEKLSITTNENSNAIRIMTIHKSKGLEFPVVIFPCDVDIYKEHTPKLWLKNLPPTFNGFTNFLINKNKSLEVLSDESSLIYKNQKEQLELDNLNLLYVALTRPIEQLFIITEKKVDKNNKFKEHLYSSMYFNYLKSNNMWDNEKLHYTFGNNTRLSKKVGTESKFKHHTNFTITPEKSNTNILLASSSSHWNTKQAKSIQYGNLVHEILAKIRTKKDIEGILQSYESSGKISNIERKKIQEKIVEITNHHSIKKYFTETYTIYNERELLFDKSIFIPDKLVLDSKKELTIIDYKTGLYNKKHEQQLLNYKEYLVKNNLRINKTLLIYIDNPIKILSI